MKISNKYMLGVIVVIAVVFVVYLSIESLRWYGGTKIYFSLFSALLIGAAIGYYISRSLTRNFAELKRTADNISKGDFTAYANVPNGAFSDETHDIAVSINLMLDNLAELTKHVTETSLKALQSSLNLYKLSDQVSDSTNEITTSFDYMNKGAGKQLLMIEQIRKTMGEMAAGSEITAKYAKEVDEFGRESTLNAGSGGKIAKETLKKLKSVFEKVDSASEQVLKFGEITGNIKTVVDVITSIAKQTNILALNASIEASKAGEAGKGFSSVVSDIKTMSEDSKNAASQISDLLKEIEEKSNKAVKSMKEVSGEVIEGRNMLAETDTSLEKIVSLVADAEKKISRISLLTDSNKIKAKEIVNYMNEVATVAEENKNATETIAQTSADQRLSIAEMSESAQQMYNLSEELKTLMAKFKLKEE